MQKENNVIKTKFENHTTNQIKKWLLDSIKGKAWERKALIFDCASHFELSAEELKDNSSNSNLTKVKAKIGQILSQMISEGDLLSDDDKKIKLAKKVTDIYKEDNIEQYIISILKNNPLNKKEIFFNCVEHFNKGEAKEVSNKTRSFAGDVLVKLTKSAVIKKEYNKYVLATDSKYPNNEIGNCLKEAAEQKDIYKYYINMLSIKGGEFFEAYSVKLLEKLLSLKNSVDSSELTGGPNDRGIDGVINITDELGYKEKILIQAKLRKRGTITLKEVREFYGAVCSEAGTRGLFITNSTFHKESSKFINKHYNIVGINNKKLFELATQYKVGIVEVDAQLKLDEDMFLDS